MDYFQIAKQINNIWKQSKIRKYALDYIFEFFRTYRFFKDELKLRQKCDENPYLFRFESDTTLKNEAIIIRNILITIKRNIKRYDKMLNRINQKENLRVILNYEKVQRECIKLLNKYYSCDGNGTRDLFRYNIQTKLKFYLNKVEVYRYFKLLFTINSRPILLNKFSKESELTFKARNIYLIFNKITAFNYCCFVIWEDKSNPICSLYEFNIRKENYNFYLKGYDTKNAIRHYEPLLVTDSNVYEIDKQIQDKILNPINIGLLIKP